MGNKQLAISNWQLAKAVFGLPRQFSAIEKQAYGKRRSRLKSEAKKPDFR